jgi:hypothetical protein
MNDTASTTDMTEAFSSCTSLTSFPEQIYDVTGFTWTIPKVVKGAFYFGGEVQVFKGVPDITIQDDSRFTNQICGT